MALETLDTQRQDEVETMEATSQTELKQRAEAVRSRARKFLSTITNTKTSSAKEISELQSYLAGMRLKEEGYDGIADREIFFEGKHGVEGWGAKMERSALTLHSRFHSDINRAMQNKWISRASQEKWIRRFEDPSASYKDREKWVQEEMPAMMQRWKEAAEGRKQLIAQKSFRMLVDQKPEFTDLLSEEKFLNTHYDKRKDLLATARASLLSTEKGQNDAYAAAQSKLQSAVAAGIMHASKIGMWLERIFRSNASPQKINAFIHGSGATSLNALMKNWALVSQRFDSVEKKFKERWEGTGIRGFHPVSKTKFLSMHYAQRLQYVEQAEDRLDGAHDVENDAPILLQIRHEMDTEDWESAAKLIAQAKMESLSPSNFSRLKSMEGFVTQFRKTQEVKEKDESIRELEQRIFVVMHDIRTHQSEVGPMAERLMHGPRADMNIHQWRWLVYNHVWCTTHGYLNHDIARKGGSKENEERTRQRSKDGKDTGRNDVIGATTSHMQAIRKREYANHSATFHHVDVTNAAANNATAEWLEHDQDPKDLYWRTYIAKDKDGPKSDNWHRDLFANLTELRSLARTMRRAGYIYSGPTGGLVNVN